MRIGKREVLCVAVALGTVAAGLLGWRAAGQVPSSETVMEILAEAGRSGRGVSAVVEERKIRAIDWARAMDREARDPGLSKRLAERIERGAGRVSGPGPE